MAESTDQANPTDPTTSETPYDPFAWTDDRKNFWKAQVDRALDIQASYHPWWDRAIQNYAPNVRENPQTYQLKARTNRSFSIVERKKADLFYQRPEVKVAPSPLLEQIPGNAEKIGRASCRERV